jgi:hypothetical protein
MIPFIAAAAPLVRNGVTAALVIQVSVAGS